LHIPLTMNASHFLTRLAATVRDARRRQGLRQEELAMAAGVSTRTVHRIEHAHPTVRLDGVLRVLDALGIEARLVDPSGE
jgi:HTH-type transcriptional regulator/antitoxin HipB